MEMHSPEIMNCRVKNQSDLRILKSLNLTDNKYFNKRTGEEQEVNG